MSKKNDDNKWRELAEQQAKESPEASSPMAESTEPGIDFPSRESLENQLTAMERQVTEYKEQALRSKAELENIRRRLERDVANAHKYGSEKLLADLLPVVDSLVRGLESCDVKDPQLQTIRQGISLTLDLLHKTLIKHGVEMIEPTKGEGFDPTLHEAMSMQTLPECKSNTVIQTLQKGYSLNGRVLRAAMVIVAQ